jgi:ATP dependent DNA ligase domain
MVPRRVLPDGFVEPCAKPPAAPGWVHEIKHDGYRLIVRHDGDTPRLFTRRGHDWTGRYPAIAAAAAKLRAKSFTLDGEAVVCGPDGVVVFDALHRRHKALAGLAGHSKEKGGGAVDVASTSLTPEQITTTQALPVLACFKVNPATLRGKTSH